MNLEIVSLVSLAISVIALMITVLSLILHRRARLIEQKPRLSLKLSRLEARDFPHGTIRLDLWNMGRVPVHLKKVQLMWGESKVGFIPFDAASGSVVSSVSEDALYPCEGRTFVLAPVPAGMLQHAVKDSAWVAIEGSEGVLARTDSAEVAPLLREIVEAAEVHLA